jgi:hypothetical protein
MLKYDEPGMRFKGYAHFKNGNIVKEKENDNY